MRGLSGAEIILSRGSDEGTVAADGHPVITSGDAKAEKRKGSAPCES